jgi:hypothetical protein
MKGKTTMDKELQGPDYAAILADMELKRTALEAAITAIRAAMAAGIFGAVGDAYAVSNGAVPPSAPALFADLPRGAFLGKTAPEAIKLYLGTIRRKQTNKEIAQALQDGGLESAGNFDNYVTSALFRLKKDGVVLRFEDGWGLSEWYNEAFRAKIGAQGTKKVAAKRTKTTRPAKKSKASVSLALTAPQGAKTPQPTVEGAQLGDLDRRVEEYLDSRSPEGVKIQEIAVYVGAPVGTTNFAVVRLAKKGFAKRGEDGRVYSTTGQQ